MGYAVAHASLLHFCKVEQEKRQGGAPTAGFAPLLHLLHPLNKHKGGAVEQCRLARGHLLSATGPHTTAATPTATGGVR
jgi:hypothetical protein